MAFINKKIVVIGGGNGIYNLLLGLSQYPVQLSSIVSTLDDGGSAGIIRKEYHTIAVGDLRRSIVGLSSLPKDLKEIIQHRFDAGFLKGHSLGNLIILAALQQDKDINKVFQIKGKVIPVTLESAHLCAKLENNQVIEGETNIDIPKHDSHLKIKEIFIKPKVQAHIKAIRAIKKADVIILGPGDLYTSVIPNLLVNGISESIKKSRAQKIFVCNLQNKLGETDNFYPADFVLEIEKYLGKDSLDYVVLPDKKIADKKNPRNHDPKKISELILKLIKHGTSKLEKPILVLDFDDTLFNTHHLKELHPDYKDNPKKTYHLNYQSLVFPDALKFLQQSNYKKFILSHAPKQYLSYQKNKIKKSGIAHHFQKIHITHKSDKVAEMEKIIKKNPYSDIYFVDDKIEPLESVKKIFPQIKTIKIRRFGHQEKANSRYIDLEIESLFPLFSM